MVKNKSGAAALVAVALVAALIPRMAAAEVASAEGDPARGKALYSRCLACHSLDRDRVGPRHCGLIGRRAGSIPDFHYSEGMRSSGIVWSEETLNRFLADPAKAVPGTTMTYAGVKDADERRDLIAWLKQAAGSKSLCP